MAWTAPMSATSNSVWTSAQWNTHVRDNLNATMIGTASAANRWIVASGVNALVERIPTSATVATVESTASTSYTNLTTVGPAVTVTTGTTALVFFTTRMSNSGANNGTSSSVDISGATTIAASDDWNLRGGGRAAANGVERSSMAHLFTTLTAGSNTFTMKYKALAGTGTFTNRTITVIPF